MIKKEFDSVDALLDYFLNALKNAEEKQEENKNNKFDIKYESSQEDLIKRLREQNKKYFTEINNLNGEVNLLRKQLTESINKSDTLSKANEMLVLDVQKYSADVKKLVEENKSLKGGPYNKDFYISVMNNLGRKIVDEYVLWLNLCKALKLEDTEMYDDINDDMYDKIPE